jgi:hypothetical protein
MVDDDVGGAPGGDAVDLPAAARRRAGATGAKGSVILMLWRPRSMIPATSNTTVRGPFAVAASRNEPGPLLARLVTRNTRPPLPPGVRAAQPRGSNGAVSA